MANIIPFKGIRYNQEKVNIEKVIAPPYDVISPEEQNALYDASPENVVRLILGREENRYESAARHLREWLDRGILVSDEKPAIYLLVQSFIDNTDEKVTRKGFIGACELVGFDRGIVLPHEKTHSKAKEDRLNLMKATESNFSQIFGLYADPERKLDSLCKRIMREQPVIDVIFEGVTNKIWIIEKPEDTDYISENMKERQLLIADGHHRYETALNYKEFRKNADPGYKGNEPYNYIMMFCTNMYDPGLVIFPTHRVIHSLENFDGAALTGELKKYYSVEKMNSAADLKKRLAEISRYAYGYVYRNSYNLIYLNDPIKAREMLPADMPEEVMALDVSLLHAHIISGLLGISAEAQEKKLHIDYIKDFTEAIGTVEKGIMQAAFLMNPTPIEHVRSVAEAGHTMPQKSTYFYPKLVSGFVINCFFEH